MSGGGRRLYDNSTQAPVDVQSLDSHDVAHQLLLEQCVFVEMFTLLTKQDWLPLTEFFDSQASSAPAIRLTETDNKHFKPFSLR